MSHRNPDEIEALRQRVAEIPSWYHAVDLGDGIETPGAFRMSDWLGDYAFPESLEGARVLDVGAANGFFAAHFASLGAKEVVAIDLPTWASHDWTPRYLESFEAKSAAEKDAIDRAVMRAGFDLVIDALGVGDRVRKVEMAIYDLSPEQLGHFDLVFCGSMLMHVRDPVLGMHAMRSVCAPDGQIVVSVAMLDSEALGIDPNEPVARFAGEWNQCNWWQLSPAGLRRLLECCDFTRIESDTTFVLENTTGEFKDPTYLCRARPRAAGE